MQTRPTEPLFFQPMPRAMPQLGKHGRSLIDLVVAANAPRGTSQRGCETEEDNDSSITAEPAKISLVAPPAGLVSKQDRHQYAHHLSSHVVHNSPACYWGAPCKPGQYLPDAKHDRSSWHEVSVTTIANEALSLKCKGVNACRTQLWPTGVYHSIVPITVGVPLFATPLRLHSL
jgi:hypothetical protein